MTSPAGRVRTPAARGSAFARRALGLLVLVAACWGTLLATAPAPAGDPVLVAVSPADGETVRSPDELRFTFDRPVPAGLATVRMTTPSGEQVVAGRPYNPPGAPDTVAVAMPPTRYGGTYSAVWSLPSSRLEPIGGTHSFHVFAPTAPAALPEVPAERDPVVAVAHTVARLAATAALTLGVGVALALALAWPAGAGHAPARRVLLSAWWALVLATLATVVTFGGYASRAPLAEAFDPALLGAALGSDIGAALLARLLVLVPITLGLVQLVTGPPAATAARRWLAAAAVLGSAAALVATWSFARPHDPAGPAPLAVGAEIALLLAVAAAIGGPVLLWTLLRGTGDGVIGDGVVREVVPRLVRVQLVSAALLLAVAVTTADGWQLGALLVLVALVAGAGLAGHRWVRGRAGSGKRDVPGRTRLRRVAAVAAGAATAALVVAAVTASPTGWSQLALTGWSAADDVVRSSR